MEGHVQVIAHRGNSEFIVGETPAHLEPAHIVDLMIGSVSPPLKLGSILSQSEPDDWQRGPGSDPDAAQRAIELVHGLRTQLLP